MKLNFLVVICFAVLCTILTLGLWPFHSPQNAVTWLANRNGLRFSSNSTVFSFHPFPLMSPNDSPAVSVEVWLRPRRIWDSGTFFAFYRPETLSLLSLRQSETDSFISTEIYGKRVLFCVDNDFRRGLPSFLTVTSDGQEVCVYIDGVLAKKHLHLPLSARDFSGRLVVGDSPRQPDSWSGQLLGIAIYHHQLTAAEAFQNYTSWKQNGRPETAGKDTISLYLFDEHRGRIIRDKAGSGVDLYIPERYQVLDKTALQPFWSEFEMSRSYWGAAFKNIVGFVPFGFCFYAYLAMLLPTKRATLITVALGTLVSLTIEVLQVFLPTRDSGTSDIITNTLGTCIGVLVYRLLTPKLARLFPWLWKGIRSMRSH